MAKRLPLFDPTTIPIKEVLSHAPSVDEIKLTALALRQRFSQTYGWEAEITNESRLALIEAVNKDDAGNVQLRPASVLIPLVMREDGLHVLLTQRTDHLNDHAGQISFPGGRAEDHDQDAIATAFREAQEEIGLELHRVEHLGNLPEYLTITGYRVTPVVALVTPQESYAPDPFEVADIFEVPLTFLMDPSNHQLREWMAPTGNRSFYAMPYENRFIWGATAGMLRNLYHFLSV
jgi:8-oxo-dGTP pyrophosphatase MutT (NUDIX family)